MAGRLSNLMKRMGQGGGSKSLQSAFDKLLLDRQVKESEARDDGMFHPSGISRTACIRKLVYDKLDVPCSPIDQQTLRIFWTGTVIHRALQADLLLTGELEKAELPCRNDKYLISGSADGLLKGGETLLEIKTINSNQFRLLSGPKDYHIDQVHLYMFCSGLRRARFLYFNKDTSDIREYDTAFNPHTNNALLDIIKSVLDYKKRKVVPPRCTSGPMEKPCNWCGYASFCWSSQQPVWEESCQKPARPKSQKSGSFRLNI